MNSYFKWRISRFVPMFGLVVFIVWIGPNKIYQLPNWGRWGIVLYVLFFVVMPPLLFPQSRLGPVPSKYMAAIQGRVRVIWKVMLWLYICTFAGGLLTLAIFPRMIPLSYAALALGVNLLFILLFRQLLFSNPGSHKSLN